MITDDLLNTLLAFAKAGVRPALLDDLSVDTVEGLLAATEGLAVESPSRVVAVDWLRAQLALLSKDSLTTTGMGGGLTVEPGAEVPRRGRRRRTRSWNEVDLSPSGGVAKQLSIPAGLYAQPWQQAQSSLYGAPRVAGPSMTGYKPVTVPAPRANDDPPLLGQRYDRAAQVRIGDVVGYRSSASEAGYTIGVVTGYDSTTGQVELNRLGQSALAYRALPTDLAFLIRRNTGQ